MPLFVTMCVVGTRLFLFCQIVVGVHLHSCVLHCIQAFYDFYHLEREMRDPFLTHGASHSLPAFLLESFPRFEGALNQVEGCKSQCASFVVFVFRRFYSDGRWQPKGQRAGSFENVLKRT